MAVIDSSVLILLSRVNKLYLIKGYFKKALITQEIYDEVKVGIGANDILNACKDWIKTENPKNSDEIISISKSEDLEKADASIIVLAIEKKKILLTNDYASVMCARSKGVECWWLTTFILRCMKKNIISKEEAKQILFELIEDGMRLSNEV